MRTRTRTRLDAAVSFVLALTVAQAASREAASAQQQQTSPERGGGRRGDGHGPPSGTPGAVQTQLQWFGHAAFKLTTPSGKVLLLDPWITNPANPNGARDLAAITRADLILVTHGHSDHVGNAAELARRTGAKLVATIDLGESLARYAGIPRAQATMETLGNFGGKLTFFDGEVNVTFVPAVHSSNVSPQDASGNPTGDLRPAGNPGGFLIEVRGGPTLYHTGDTDVFADMALLRRFGPVTVMLACIGGHFTMDPARAAEAVSLVQPRIVVPMHFGTFPLLRGTPAALGEELQRRHVRTQVRAMQVGETMSL